MITNIIICFDPRNSVEKTKHDQLQLHPNGLVIADD
jgi:hypothetical protein